jgi:NAD(P)-dependent dehydrogenase (short-subunit alcohol dehydrogenase family)
MTSGAIYPSLKGRTVLITGGGSGIGEAITRHFVAQGAKVGFLDLNKEASEALVADLAPTGTVHFEQCDLRDIDALKNAIANVRAKLGPITILVNNAAHDERHKFEDVTPAYWDERMQVNLRHQFFAGQAIAPDMKAAGGGVIINMGSTTYMIGQGGMPGYSAAKAAIHGLTRSMARDLGPFNIRVCSIAPGWIMTQRQIDLWLTPEGEKDLMNKQCLKRRLYPDDIAGPVLFLASDDAGACTNQTYVVDGGWI